MSSILTEFNDLIGTITFNNNAKRNCLSAALLKELIAAGSMIARTTRRARTPSCRKDARFFKENDRTGRLGKILAGR